MVDSLSIYDDRTKFIASFNSKQTVSRIQLGLCLLCVWSVPTRTLYEREVLDNSLYSWLAALKKSIRPVSGKRALLYNNRNVRATAEFIWAAMLENVPSEMCTQRRFRSACAFAQSDLNLHWEYFGQQGMQRFFMRRTKTLIRLRRCAAWFESRREHISEGTFFTLQVIYEKRILMLALGSGHQGVVFYETRNRPAYSETVLPVSTVSSGSSCIPMYLNTQIFAWQGFTLRTLDRIGFEQHFSPLATSRSL